MSATTEIIITLPKQRRVDAQVGQHVVHTDQPVDNGGEGIAPCRSTIFLPRWERARASSCRASAPSAA